MPQSGLKVRGNIDVSRIQPVKNQDGSVSTVRTISIGTDQGEALIPTVVNGRVVGNQEAIDEYRRTGNHLGIFDTPENATAYAQQLHQSEAQRIMPPQTQIYKVRAPDGTIIKVQGPAGASPDEVIRQAQSLSKPKEDTAAILANQKRNFPSSQEMHAGGSGVRPAPAGNFSFAPLKSVPDDNDISGESFDLSNFAPNELAAHGNALSPAGMARGAKQAVDSPYRDLGALGNVLDVAMPLIEQVSRERTFSGAAGNVVGNLTGGAMVGRTFGAAAGAPAAAREFAGNMPESLMTKAGNVRKFAEAVKPRVPVSTWQVPVEATRAGLNLAARGTANVLERGARGLAQFQEAPKVGGPAGPLPGREAFGLERNAVQPEAMPRNFEGTTEATVTPRHEPLNPLTAAADEARRMATVRNFEPADNTPPPWELSEEPRVSIPRPGPGPELRDFLAENDMARSLAERQASMEEAWQNRGNFEPEPRRMVPRIEPEPVGVDRPGLNVGDRDFLATPPQAAEPINPLRRVEELLAPSGTKLKKASQMMDAQGNPTRLGERLLNEVPELASAETPEIADRMLMEGLETRGKAIEAAESAVPPETPINAETIADQIAGLMDNYVGDEPSIAQLNKEWERWAGQKSVPWGEFVKIKRNLGKNLRSPALRQAYRVLMDTSSGVSEDLAKANQSYSTVRRALEGAGVDTNTGRRVGTVGKPQKPPREFRPGQ